MEINELKQKIQSLISQTDKDYKKVKDTYTFLYKNLDQVKELQTIKMLKKFSGGDKYLQAYFMYKFIARANYQMEHLQLTNFEDEENSQQNLLKVISADIEQFEKDKKEKEQSNEQPTNEELLKMLGERIATGEIKRELGQFGNYLMIENEQGILKVDLQDGRIEPKQEETDIFLSEPVKEMKQPNTTELKYSADFKDYVESVRLPNSNSVYISEEDYKGYKSKLTEKEKNTADAMAEAIHGEDKNKEPNEKK